MARRARTEQDRRDVSCEGDLGLPGRHTGRLASERRPSDERCARGNHHDNSRDGGLSSCHLQCTLQRSGERGRLEARAQHVVKEWIDPGASYRCAAAGFSVALGVLAPLTEWRSHAVLETGGCQRFLLLFCPDHRGPATDLSPDAGSDRQGARRHAEVRRRQGRRGRARNRGAVSRAATSGVGWRGDHAQELHRRADLRTDGARQDSARRPRVRRRVRAPRAISTRPDCCPSRRPCATSSPARIRTSATR